MACTGQGSGSGRVVGNSGLVCGEGGHGDAVHKGELLHGLGAAEGG